MAEQLLQNDNTFTFLHISFLFLELGIFSLKLGKKTYYWALGT
jgi:hypothetical protein